jgi:hypothetical protein
MYTEYKEDTFPGLQSPTRSGSCQPNFIAFLLLMVVEDCRYTAVGNFTLSCQAQN